jgi:hypothetical protein
MSTTAIATTKQTAAIDSRRQIHSGARVLATVSPQEEGGHIYPRNLVESRRVLADNAMHDASATKQAMTRTTLKREVFLTGVMTEARVSEWSDLDMEEAGDRWSDAPTPWRWK